MSQLRGKLSKVNPGRHPEKLITCSGLIQNTRHPSKVKVSLTRRGLFSAQSTFSLILSPCDISACNEWRRVTMYVRYTRGIEMSIKALNRYAERGQPRLNTVSKEEWAEAMNGFTQRARYDAANLAAHNWDVTAIGEELLICSPWGGGHWWVKGSDEKRRVSDSEYECLYPEVGKDYRDPAICWEGEGQPKKKVLRDRLIKTEWLEVSA